MGNIGMTELVIFGLIALAVVAVLAAKVTSWLTSGSDRPDRDLTEATERRIDALENEVMTLSQELADLHERLDFADRLLAARGNERIEG